MLLNSSITRLIASKRGGVKIKVSNGQPHYNAKNRSTWWRKGPNIVFGYNYLDMVGKLVVLISSLGNPSLSSLIFIATVKKG